MKIATFGVTTVLYSWIFFLVFLISSYFLPYLTLRIFTVIFGVLAVFNLFFFRDPERNIIKDQKKILSPADGKVVVVKKIDYEPEFLKTEAYQVSIFLSVFNVHVNRNPVSGTVELFRYKKGKFLAAFKHEASESNEQTLIGIENESGKVLFKQIAGLIARRIICTLREGNKAEQGERMGMIMYGSRVDVFFPVNAKPVVEVGQTVKAGTSIIGEF
ncbi:MAG: phosphatidylserine decarboxylase family protein [Calditrichia bacterium]